MVTSMSTKAAPTPPIAAPHTTALQVLPSEDVSACANRLNQTGSVIN